MNAPREAESPKNPPHRAWVWHCTDKSIATGHISVLALAETFFAVGLYWWLSFRFEWHWFSIVCLIAAPILLLRSQESVGLGVEMLRHWHKREDSDESRLVKLMLIMIPSMLGFWVAYSLNQTWLSGHIGWALCWRSGVISVIMFIFAGAALVAGTGYDAGAVMPVFAVADTFSKFFVPLLFAPAFAVGALWRALFIRYYACLRHLLPGLRRLPCNWHENLLAIDLTHPPELLPLAGRVDKSFSVTGLWRDIPNHDEEGYLKSIRTILIIAWYIPALAYRWSLKASAWPWWPLALALTPPFQGLDGYARREQAALVSRGTWAIPLLLPLTVLVWLLLSLWPETKEWLTLLSPAAAEPAQKLLSKLAPPPIGLRYGLLWLVVLLSLALAWYRRNFLAAYEQVLVSPKEYRELTPGEQQHFDTYASTVEQLRLLMIVVLFLLGEAVALAFMHARNPVEIERLIWPWLLRWL